VVTGTNAPRLPAIMRWRKGRLERGLRRRAHGPSCALTACLLQSIKVGVSYTERHGRLRNK
jgi:hypothetical protein